MNRLGILLLCTLVVSTTVTLVAPSASAGCDPHIPATCVRCVYGYPGQGCIVTNPCDPRYCRIGP